jgi:hypothetical protein
LEKPYYISEVTVFSREYHIVRDYKKFSIYSHFDQISLDEEKHLAEWGYLLDYPKNKEEWIFFWWGDKRIVENGF